MDIFAHGLWSYIFFHRTQKPFYAVLFGLLPDVVSFGVYTIYRIFTGIPFGPPDPATLPSWVFMMYGIGHSLLVASLVIFLIYFFLKKVPIYIWAWPIAILLDIPTHTRHYLPTPFLWPVFDWAFPGISWGSSWFMIVNYTLITFFLVRIYLLHNRKNVFKENQ